MEMRGLYLEKTEMVPDEVFFFGGDYGDPCAVLVPPKLKMIIDKGETQAGELCACHT